MQNLSMEGIMKTYSVVFYYCNKYILVLCCQIQQYLQSTLIKKQEKYKYVNSQRPNSLLCIIFKFLLLLSSLFCCHTFKNSPYIMYTFIHTMHNYFKWLWGRYNHMPRTGVLPEGRKHNGNQICHVEPFAMISTHRP